MPKKSTIIEQIKHKSIEYMELEVCLDLAASYIKRAKQLAKDYSFSKSSHQDRQKESQTNNSPEKNHSK